MNNQFLYETEVEWTGGRRGLLAARHLPIIDVAPPPEFQGDDQTWTPEHLFVASVNSCYMATFAALAEMSKLEFVSFASKAVGRLEKLEGQGYRVTEIILKPKLVVRFEHDLERAERILEKAERNCFISNSIKSEVRLSPEITAEKALATWPR